MVKNITKIQKQEKEKEKRKQNTLDYEIHSAMGVECNGCWMNNSFPHIL